MAIYEMLLGGYDAETKTYSACAIAGALSPFTPIEKAKLIGLKVIVSRAGATTLVNHVQFKLTCATFNPNSIEAHGQGSGLQTAPALSGSQAETFNACMQKVDAGVPITVEARNLTADTPVGVEAYIYGVFDNGKPIQ